MSPPKFHSPRKNPDAQCHQELLAWIEKACISDSAELLHKLAVYWDYSESFLIEIHPDSLDIYLCHSFSVVNQQIISAIRANLTLFYMFFSDDTSAGISKFCFEKRYMGGDYLSIIRNPVHKCNREPSCGCNL